MAMWRGVISPPVSSTGLDLGIIRLTFSWNAPRCFISLSARQSHCKEVFAPVFELFSTSAVDYWVSYLTYSPYITILLLLIAGIWFIPLAEEIALVAAGYLYYSDQVQLTTMLMLLGLGVFCGDFVGFWVGRRWRGSSPRAAFPLLHHSKLGRTI